MNSDTVNSDTVNSDTVESQNHSTIIIGNNATAVDQATKRARQCFSEVHGYSASQCEGSAEEVGQLIADQIVQCLLEDRSVCFVSGGEPTVELADASIRGLGGRNQQLVLAAYRRLCESQLSEQDWRRIVVLSGGTDGEDGPTDAAGAWIDYKVHDRIVELGLDVNDSLRRNDAYRFSKPVADCSFPGPPVRTCVTCALRRCRSLDPANRLPPSRFFLLLSSGTRCQIDFLSLPLAPYCVSAPMVGRKRFTPTSEPTLEDPVKASIMLSLIRTREG